MVHLGVVPLDAATQPVLATRPAQVSPRHVAAIAKNERVGRLRIAKIQSLGKHETREAVINAWITRGSHIVRAGNLQVIQSLWRSEVKGRTQPQTGETEVPVQQHIRTERVRRSQPDALDQAWRIA